MSLCRGVANAAAIHIRKDSAAIDRSCEGRLANSLVVAVNAAEIAAGPNIFRIDQAQPSLTSGGSKVWRKAVPIKGKIGNPDKASSNLGDG